MAEQPTRDSGKPDDSGTKGAAQNPETKPAEQALAPKGRRHDGGDASEAPESGDKKTSGQ